MPVSPVFSLPHDIEHAILIQYSNEKSLAESIAGLAHSTLFDDPDLLADKLAAVVDTSAVVGTLED